MASHFVVLLLSLSFAAALITPFPLQDGDAQYKYDILYFTQNLDHFNFADSRTYEQRYLVSTASWRKPQPGVEPGPIFFYTGNEGDITLFAANTGFLWEAAEEFEAIVIFAEHRYYGASLPFGNATYSNNDNLAWLTSEQALADYAELLTWFKASTPGAATSKVISFGGSYGGMLSAWIRLKYPSIVHGSIAASAPVLQFTGITGPEAFNNILTRDFLDADPNCSAGIRASWGMLKELVATPAGRNTMAELLGLCEPLAAASELANLYQWLSSAWAYMAMADYPYPASFLGPMPAWPVNASCAAFSNVSIPKLGDATNHDVASVLTAVRGAFSIYYNYTGQTGKCYNISAPYPPGLGDNGWNIQACTEMIMPMSQDGTTDMLWPAPWNLTAYVESCAQTWAPLTARPYWIPINFGGDHLSAASNIVFSNGMLDPWRGGGVVNNISETVHAILIEKGAHHLDLRASNPLDPPSVIWARNFEKEQISLWLKQ